MYRDELEAQRARLSTLEAELAQARQRRRELEASAAAARQARQQAKRASEGEKPARGLRWFAVGLALALCATLVLGFNWVKHQIAEASVARAKVAELEHRTAQITARIAEARGELEREKHRCPPPAPAPPSTSSLGRGQIQAAMRAVKPAVQACYDRFQVPGTTFVRLTVEPTGNVSSIRVQGIFSGTPTGGCVLQAVRGVRFPAFTGQAITFDYPFILR